MRVRRDSIDRGDVRTFYSTYFNESGRHPCVRVRVRPMVCRTLRAAASHASANPRRVLPCIPLRCSTGLPSALGRGI